MAVWTVVVSRVFMRLPPVGVRQQGQEARLLHALGDDVEPVLFECEAIIKSYAQPLYLVYGFEPFSVSKINGWGDCWLFGFEQYPD